MLKLIALFEAYGKKEDGATAIEYGLIAAGIGVAIAAVVGFVGGDLNSLFGTVRTELGGTP